MLSALNSAMATFARFNMEPIRGFWVAPINGRSMYLIGERWFDKKDTDAICAGKKPYVLDDGTERFWNGNAWSNKAS